MKTSLFCGLFAMSLTLAACGGGGSSGGGDSIPSSLLITDAPADDLLAFHATVEGVSLMHDDGRLTENLISGAIELELLGLDDVLEWIASRPLPKGTYTGVQVSFTPGSYAAVAKDGTPIAVDAVSDTWDVTFVRPIPVADDYHRIVIDLDVRASLSGDVTAGVPLVFNASGDASGDDGADAQVIDEIQGVVREIDTERDVLLLDAFADDDLQVPLGPVEVALDDETLTADENDFIDQLPEDFYTRLGPLTTLVEVRGQIGSNGVVRATKVQIGDQSGGETLVGEVEIEGIVLAATPDSFTLLIREIEKGADLAEPILATLPEPRIIQIAYEGDTPFYVDDATLLDEEVEDSLTVGTELEVEFDQFLSEPFLAKRAQVNGGGPKFLATVADVSTLPDSIVVNVAPNDLLVSTGVVESDATPVTVDLSGAGAITLDAQGEPSLTSAELVSGLGVEIRGAVTGDASAPHVTLRDLEVRPGHLTGARVGRVDAEGALFHTSGGTTDGALGADNSPGPFEVAIAPTCSFEGDVASATEFFDLFSKYRKLEYVAVDVAGIGTETGKVKAFEIRVEVKPLTPPF